MLLQRKNLFALYGIQATLQLDETKQYPICVDFHLKEESAS